MLTTSEVSQGNVIELVKRLNDLVESDEALQATVWRPYTFESDGIDYRIKFIGNVVWDSNGNSNEFGYSENMDEVKSELKHATEIFIQESQSVKTKMFDKLG